MTETVEPSDRDLQKAIRLINEGEWQRGMGGLKSIIVNFPQCAIADDAYYLLGLGFLEVGSNAKAATCFQRILENYPSSNVHRYATLQLEKIRNELDPAHKLFMEAENFFRENKLEDALRSFKKLLKEYPKSSLGDNALLYAGLLFKSSEKSNYKKEAQKIFHRIIEEYPESDSAYFLQNNPELLDLIGAEVTP